MFAYSEGCVVCSLEFLAYYSEAKQQQNKRRQNVSDMKRILVGAFCFLAISAITVLAADATMKKADFSKIDTDGDGSITLAEYKAYVKQYPASGMTEASFQEMDRDSNGVVTLQEWTVYINTLGRTGVTERTTLTPLVKPDAPKAPAKTPAVVPEKTVPVQETTPRTK